MPLTAFEKTLQRIDNFCRKNTIQYALIGGISVIIYQIARTTQDIDITLLIEIDELQTVGGKIITEYKAEKENPIDFFQKYYVLPVSDKHTNIHIDFSAGLSGFDRMVVKRSKRKLFGEVEVSVCSVEDLIIYKLVAARSQDMVDIENLIQLHLNKIDKTYLEKIAGQFTEVERDDVINNLKNLLNKYSKNA
jgi:hypothetical protein